LWSNCRLRDTGCYFCIGNGVEQSGRGDGMTRNSAAGGPLFCQLMPFVAFGMMTKRMAEDHFEGLRELWSAEPLPLTLLFGLTFLLSGIAIAAMIRLWRKPQP